MFEKAGFEVVGEAVDGASAISASADLLPEIVILDIRLPDIDGFEVAERLTDVPGSPIVVLVSTSDASDYGRRLTSAPAAGFITKSELSVSALTDLGLRNQWDQSGPYRYQGPNSPGDQPDRRERHPLGFPWEGLHSDGCRRANVASWHWSQRVSARLVLHQDAKI